MLKRKSSIVSAFVTIVVAVFVHHVRYACIRFDSRYSCKRGYSFNRLECFFNSSHATRAWHAYSSVHHCTT